jgi:hypothetical protein
MRQLLNNLITQLLLYSRAYGVRRGTRRDWIARSLRHITQDYSESGNDNVVSGKRERVGSMGVTA